MPLVPTINSLRVLSSACTQNFNVRYSLTGQVLALFHYIYNPWHPLQRKLSAKYSRQEKEFVLVVNTTKKSVSGKSCVRTTVARRIRELVLTELRAQGWSRNGTPLGPKDSRGVGTMTDGVRRYPLTGCLAFFPFEESLTVPIAQLRTEVRRGVEVFVEHHESARIDALEHQLRELQQQGHQGHQGHQGFPGSGPATYSSSNHNPRQYYQSGGGGGGSGSGSGSGQRHHLHGHDHNQRERPQVQGSPPGPPGYNNTPHYQSGGGGGQRGHGHGHDHSRVRGGRGRGRGRSGPDPPSVSAWAAPGPGLEPGPITSHSHSYSRNQQQQQQQQQYQRHGHGHGHGHQAHQAHQAHNRSQEDSRKQPYPYPRSQIPQERGRGLGRGRGRGWGRGLGLGQGLPDEQKKTGDAGGVSGGTPAKPGPPPASAGSGSGSGRKRT